MVLIRVKPALNRSLGSDCNRRGATMSRTPTGNGWNGINLYWKDTG